MPDATLTPAVFHILLALAGEDLHGLGIAKAIDDATEGAVRLGPGTLYRSLKEMGHSGMIEEVTPDEASDPRRRTYRITEHGRAIARDEAARLARVLDVARQNRVLPETL